MDRARTLEHLPVLVVDDEEVVRKTLEALLTRAGYPVVLASNGEEALARVDSGELLMVITDVEMPGISGLDLLRRIHQVKPTLPVLIVTGYPSIERVVEAIKHGAVDFIPKPFEGRWVLDAVRRAIQARTVAARSVATQAFIVTHVKARVPSRVDHVMGLLHFLSERTLMADSYPVDEAFQIRLALDEALANALRHGNRGDATRWITLEADLKADFFDATVEDEGMGFDPALISDPTRDEGRFLEGGRGLFLIRCHMDGIEHNARGNRIHMWKSVRSSVAVQAQAQLAEVPQEPLTWASLPREPQPMPEVAERAPLPRGPGGRTA